MRVLKVQGKGRVTTEPDIVTLSFQVETRAMDYAACLTDLNSRTEELRAGMKAAGINRASIKTTSFGVRAETQYKQGRHIFSGYSASHHLHIELPIDKELLNEILRHIAHGHSGAVINITFSVKDRDALRKRVLAEAVRVAQTNAQVLADTAGIKIGRLLQMDYGWSEVRIYNHDVSMVCEAGPAMPRYAADIEPEDVATEDTVTMVYEINE